MSMERRRRALDRAQTHDAAGWRPPSPERYRLRIDDFAGAAAALEESGLAEAIVARLSRNADLGVPGFAVLEGLTRFGPLAARRRFHTELFEAVCGAYSLEESTSASAGAIQVSASVTRDGDVDAALYGSSWTYKRPHMDREVALFSHMYGPNAGFVGGEPYVIDAGAYLAINRLGFDAAFEWADEPGESKKPVLRRVHEEAAMSRCGVDLGALGTDSVLFVNNEGEAGILHGAAPVRVSDRRRFVREIHRCAARPLARPDGH